MCARILVEITMKLTHFDKEILPLSFFYIRRLGNMGKTQLVWVELLAFHLNKVLSETCSCFRKGILCMNFCLRKCTEDCYNKKVHKQ